MPMNAFNPQVTKKKPNAMGAGPAGAGFPQSTGLDAFMHGGQAPAGAVPENSRGPGAAAPMPSFGPPPAPGMPPGPDSSGIHPPPMAAAANPVGTMSAPPGPWDHIAPGAKSPITPQMQAGQGQPGGMIPDGWGGAFMAPSTSAAAPPPPPPAGLSVTNYPGVSGPPAPAPTAAPVPQGGDFMGPSMPTTSPPPEAPPVAPPQTAESGNRGPAAPLMGGNPFEAPPAPSPAPRNAPAPTPVPAIPGPQVPRTPEAPPPPGPVAPTVPLTPEAAPTDFMAPSAPPGAGMAYAGGSPTFDESGGYSSSPEAEAARAAKMAGATPGAQGDFMAPSAASGNVPPPTQQTAQALTAPGQTLPPTTPNTPEPAPIDWSSGKMLLPEDTAELNSVLRDALSRGDITQRQYNQILELRKQEEKNQEAADRGDSVKQQKRSAKKITKLTHKLAGLGDISFGTAPTTGTGGTDLTDPLVGPTTQDPATGDYNFGTPDINGPLPDIFNNNMSPADRQAFIDWTLAQQHREDQEAAANQMGGLIDQMETDPSRLALQDFLKNSAQTPTYTPEQIEAMKTSGRETADNSFRSLDEEVRKYAAQSGRPVSDFTSMMAEGKQGIIKDLMASNRGLDATAATSAATDRARTFDYYNNAQGALYGFLSPAYGNQANLIAGQNLAGTTSGWASSKMAEDAQKAYEKSLGGGTDWLSVIMQGAGTAAKAFGGK